MGTRGKRNEAVESEWELLSIWCSGLRQEETLQDFKEQSDCDPVDSLQRARPEARRPRSEQGHRL